ARPLRGCSWATRRRTREQALRATLSRRPCDLLLSNLNDAAREQDERRDRRCHEHDGARQLSPGKRGFAGLSLALCVPEDRQPESKHYCRHEDEFRACGIEQPYGISG